MKFSCQGGIFYLNLIAVALGLAFCHPAQFMALNFSHMRARVVSVCAFSGHK